jgi:hypothetical protein
MRWQLFPQDQREEYDWYVDWIPSAHTITQYFKKISDLQVEENCIGHFDFWAATRVHIKRRPVYTQPQRVQGDALQRRFVLTVSPQRTTK